MPQFYFDVVHKGDDVAADTEGSDLNGLSAARAEAEEAAREIVAEAVKAGKVIDGDFIKVSDERGEVVYTLPLRDVIHLDDRGRSGTAPDQD